MNILHKTKITAAILLVLTSLAARALDAPSAIVPAGLSSGDEFYIVFLTSTAIDATSTDIATYNTHVNAAADLSSVKGTDDPSIVWKALVATTGGGDQCDIYNSADDDVPVYNTLGQKLADDWLDMYVGSLDAYIRSTEDGSEYVEIVWTGCNTDGSAATEALGSANPAAGSTGSSSINWIRIGTGDKADAYKLYAVSPKLTVAAPNTAPVISGSPATSVAQDSAYSFTPTVTDPDTGDTTTFSITNKPNWATFNTSTGALTGTPSQAHIGTTSGIVISVQDAALASDSLASFNLTVTSIGPSVRQVPASPMEW